jgi:hypothetical protein
VEIKMELKTVRDVCQYIGSAIGDNPVCIETGTMYTCNPGNEPHNTTSNILEFICHPPKNGTLFSLDIDPEHIKFSMEWNRRSGVHLHCIEGDSVESLLELSEMVGQTMVDFLCLDGKEFDEDHMVNEFNAIKDCLAEKHFVLVDDIHNPGSVKYKKMVPLLKELGYSYIEVPTPTGMFLATKGYPLPF